MQDEALTGNIIKAFFQVYNSLGYGFLEKVYENAMAVELALNGLRVRQQMRINVYYKGQSVGEYWADMTVNERILLELKAKENLCEEHRWQLVNYLRATNYEVGLLLNFGRKPELRRVIYQNCFKTGLKQSEGSLPTVAIK